MSAYRVWCTDCYGCIHNTGPVKEPICSKCFKTSMDGMPSEYKQQRITFTTIGADTSYDNKWNGDTNSAEARNENQKDQA